MNELIQLTAAEAAAKLAAGKITSVELTQAHLDLNALFIQFINFIYAK